jgi:hypothetical protein
MRVTPTVTTYNPVASNAQIRNGSASAECSGTSVAGGEKHWQLTWTNSGSGAVGNILSVQATLDAEI